METVNILIKSALWGQANATQWLFFYINNSPKVLSEFCALKIVLDTEKCSHFTWTHDSIFIFYSWMGTDIEQK